MDMILIKDVSRLGKAGQVVTVKDGHARNFLIPQGFAVPANDSNRRWLENQKANADRQKEASRTKAQDAAARFEHLSCVIPMKGGEQGRIHGAVTAKDIADWLISQGISITKQQVCLDGPITRLGSFEVPLKLHSEVMVQLKVQVVQG